MKKKTKQNKTKTKTVNNDNPSNTQLNKVVNTNKKLPPQENKTHEEHTNNKNKQISSHTL